MAHSKVGAQAGTPAESGTLRLSRNLHGLANCLPSPGSLESCCQLTEVAVLTISLHLPGKPIQRSGLTPCKRRLACTASAPACLATPQAPLPRRALHAGARSAPAPVPGAAMSEPAALLPQLGQSRNANAAAAALAGAPAEKHLNAATGGGSVPVVGGSATPCARTLPESFSRELHSLTGPSARAARAPAAEDVAIAAAGCSAGAGMRRLPESLGQAAQARGTGSACAPDQHLPPLSFAQARSAPRAWLDTLWPEQHLVLEGIRCFVVRALTAVNSTWRLQIGLQGRRCY